MELIKDYNLEILYHPGKENVVADTLSRKRTYGMAVMLAGQRSLFEDMGKLDLEVLTEEVKAQLASLSL